MKQALWFAALATLAGAVPAHASSLLCRPQLSAMLPFELRLDAEGSAVTGLLSLEGQSRAIVFTEATSGPITRYLAEGYTIAFSKTSFVPARNPFPADAGRAIAAKAEQLTLLDGAKLENIDLACVRLVLSSSPAPAPAEAPTMPSATYGEMIQLMSASEEDRAPSQAAGSIGDAIQAL